MKDKLVIEVVHGVEGDCLVIDDTRVAGPKPWGGGHVTKTWYLDVDQVQSVVNICNKMLGKSANKKTLEDVKHDAEKDGCGADVMTTLEFAEAVERGSFTYYDGFGFFHDGVSELDLGVPLDVRLLIALAEHYPYVCWYNK